MLKRFLLLLSIGPSLALAQSGTLSEETLWKMGMVSDPRLSADGSKLVYSVRFTDLKLNKGQNELYVLDFKTNLTNKVTNTPTVSESQARWRPDGKKIGYLSAESGTMQLWEMNPDGNDKKRVSDIEGGIDGFEYSPTQSHILYYKAIRLDPSTQDLFPGLDQATGKIYDALMYRHWNAWHDGTYQHVFFTSYKEGDMVKAGKDIMEGEKFDSPLKPHGGIDQITWSPDGKSIVYVCKKLNGTASATSTNSDLYWYQISDGTTKNLTEENKGYDTDPHFSRDGSKLVYSSMERDGYEADRNRLMLLDLATMKKTELTAGFDYNAYGAEWSLNGKEVFFKVDYKGCVQVFSYVFNPKKGVAPIRQVTMGRNNYSNLQASKDSKGEVIYALRQSMDRPNEVYRIDAKTGQITPISTINDAIYDRVKIGRVESREVKTTDGKNMLAWVIYPPDFDPNKKYPTLLYCQGGPQSMVGQSFSLRWNFQLMAAKGYIVIAPNRRGLPGFGQAWNEQISGDWGGQAMQDMLSAIDDIAKETYVDKDRLGAVGASFGGYTVYWLMGNHNKRFKSFIAHCGVFNLEAMYGATEEIFFSDFEMKGPYWNMKEPNAYTKFSPHKFIQNWDTPILVIHNDKDFRVPLTEGLQAFSAAQLKGLKSRFLYFPDEGHWVVKPQNSVLWNRVFFDWLDKTLKK